MGLYKQIRAGQGCPRCAAMAHRRRCERERHRPEAYYAAGTAAGLEWLGPAVANANAQTQWRCRTCGDPWRASYHKIAGGRGCPRCGLDRRDRSFRLPADRYVELARERGIEWRGSDVPSRRRKTRWRCDKGHEWEASYNSIIRGTGCHVCTGRVNGVLVSHTQRELARRLGGELNHRVGRSFIDVALERQGVRIAVEFDPWYYHGHPGVQAYDEARDHVLIQAGWRVLRIRSGYRLPSPQELEAAIECLIAGEQRVLLTLSGWGVGPCRGAKFAREREPQPFPKPAGGRNA